MGEDNEARSGAVDRISVGGCLWVHSKEGRKMGKPKRHILRRKIRAENDPKDGFIR